MKFRQNQKPLVAEKYLGYRRVAKKLNQHNISQKLGFHVEKLDLGRQTDQMKQFGIFDYF